MNNLLRLNFLPRSYDLALLVLRIWIGASLLLIHGMQKLTHFSQMSAHFPDPLHIGSRLSLVLLVIAEVIGAIFVMLGLATRIAALIIIIDLSVAFSMVHHFAFSGPHSGELPYVYLGGFVTIFLAGAGRFSVDRA
jgi:putative oxidoreductase